MSAETTASDGTRVGGAGAPQRVVARLLLSSFLMLFLELALIRWLGANVVHLSYFSNFVLLGSFLGIGAGFLISRRTWSIWPASMPLLAALVAAVLLVPVTIQRQGDDVIYFTSLEVDGPPAWIALPVVFLLVAAILAGPAEQVGRCFARLPPLTAYRWDLVGSLLGIGAFTLLSFLRAPSVVWGVVACAAYLVLTPTRISRVVSAFGTVVVVGLLVMETAATGVSWSPYYKVTTDKPVEVGDGFLLIKANGVPHQLMAPAEWKMDQGEQIYTAPYRRLPDNDLGNVLVVGAGSGSDVAIALRQGARHVDAVDIDPRILQIGREANIDRPYDDPAVDVHTNDGRAFLEGAERQYYDLVLFALPDSLTLVNGASQIRLESFLFTTEAMRSVKEHLAPGGAFAMYNYYREPWLIDRLANTANEVFGHYPCVDLYGGNQAVITIGLTVADQACETVWQPSGEVIEPATDDAPFLYFRGDSFPPLYAITLGGILLLSLVVVRVLGGPAREMRPYADLFFMGAAFLLLETKNVATFALLFGTTWFVNALVFAGVLVVVLAAVETTRRFRTPPLPVVFAGIAGALALAWLVPTDLLLGLPFVPRLLTATALAFLPIFLANVAFSKRFAESADSQAAFAVNLLGAIVGGCLEYAALVTGYHALLIVTGGLYLVAFLLTPGRRTSHAVRV